MAAPSTGNYLDSSQYYGKETNVNFAKFNPKETNVGTIGGLDGSTDTLTKKQDASTDGGCGTAFTTATEPEKINVQQSLGGHVSKIETVNPDGDTQVKVITSDGKSITLAEDGSVIVTTAKREGDPKSGRFDVRAHGSTRFLVGEALMIEVENKTNVNAAKDGDTKTAVAFSLKVYGNVAIECVGGELNAKAKNITLSADNEITFNAGSKISMLSGAGKGQNKSSTTSSGATKEAKVDYGGLIEMKGGDMLLDAQTIRQTSAVDYKVVSHEGATISTKSLANYGFKSPGSFTLEVAGDYHEDVKGLKRTTIGGTSNPVTSLFPGQSDGYLISVGALATPSAKGVSPAALSILASKGGLIFNTKSGDIDIYTTTGYWGIGSTQSVVAGVDKVNPQYPNVKAGVYVQGTAALPVTIRSKTKVEMYTNTIEKSGISIDVAKLSIKNPTGIYLN